MRVWTSNGKRTACKKPFKCPFCNHMEELSYSIVDGSKSCRRCDREYSAVTINKKITCPLCKGVGHFEATKE